MENRIDVKGAGIRALFRLYVEPEDNTEVNQNSQETTMNATWTKLWERLDKKGKEITEKGVIVSAKKSGKITNIKVGKKKQVVENINSTEDKSIVDEDRTK